MRRSAAATLTRRTSAAGSQALIWTRSTALSAGATLLGLLVFFKGSKLLRVSEKNLQIYLV